MSSFDLQKIIADSGAHTYQSINFGCRVNASEVNLLSQLLINYGLSPVEKNADLYLVNTCAITKKGEYESLSKIRKLFSKSIVLATGCADLAKLNSHPNLIIFDNITKEKLLQNSSGYDHQIGDKFSTSQKFVLRVQSGCSTNCTFCIVPSRRPYVNSIPIDMAIDIVKKAVADDYKELILTGVNLVQYTPGFSNLLEAILQQTKIEKITFGSIPLLCIDEKFINLYKEYSQRLSHFLHIPLQSGSDKILKLMHRPYTVKKIKEVFEKLNKIKINNKNVLPPLSRGGGRDSGRRGLSFGTDIIVGFPTETEADFQETYDLCQSIGFSKIHVFRYSPRPGTLARELFLKSLKITKNELSRRSNLIQSISNL